ncbi:fructose-1,6-bisphosphate aldolase, class II [candidate division KSB1 bacterium 4572_119]|nr:MAG: fructose-1,6-bisphosphate aldolase, class II [candidate division KSB1 bacterium 4572_119]
MLVTNKYLQTEAQKGQYAVGAFNTSNIEITQAIIEAHEEKNAPVIIATSTSAIKYCGIEVLSSVVRKMAEKASIPVSLHLDHGTDYDLIIDCVRNGWTSIMIDGSHASLEENIHLTSEIVKVCHGVGISVEAELGRLGGIEDNISVDEKDARLTDTEEAVRFVKETQCDTLAIAIGTSHGAYKFKGESKLAFDRLEEIKSRIDVPLVLHGASSVIPEVLEKANKYGANLGAAKGVPVEDIKKAISLGITKVNIDTDLRLAFTAGVRQILTEKPEVFDPRKIIGAGRDDIKDVVKAKIDVLGCANKA